MLKYVKRHRRAKRVRELREEMELVEFTDAIRKVTPPQERKR